jgi:hypothetical protein
VASAAHAAVAGVVWSVIRSLWWLRRAAVAVVHLQDDFESQDIPGASQIAACAELGLRDGGYRSVVIGAGRVVCSW